MRIVIAAEIFSPDIGGPATYSEKLSQELVKRGNQISLICYSSQLNNDNYPFKIKRILRGQNTLFRYLKYFWYLFWLSRGADVIYAQGPVGSGLPALLVSKILRKKFVVKVVGDYAWEQATNFKRIKNLKPDEVILIDEFQNIKLKGKIGWLKKIERLVCKNTNKVIVPSQYLKKIVMGWGVEENKIEVIYNAPDLINKYGVISKEDARNKFDFKNNDFVIVSVGRGVVLWKGFGLLTIVVAELIKEKNIPIKLRILGVENWEQISRLIKLYKDKVVYEEHPIKGDDRYAEVLRVEDEQYYKEVPVGIQPPGKVREYLLAADLFVLNSGYEGLSHAILEAMAFGTPVITTNVGGSPELIINGENGLLVEYNNKEQLKEAILKLYNNHELREKFVNNSKEVLKKFSFKVMINETIKVLEL